MSKQRIAIVFDGTYWFLRGIRLIEHDLDLDEKVYRCDKPIGGPFESADQAVQHIKEEGILKDD